MENPEPIHCLIFDEVPLYCPHCKKEIAARVWDSGSKRWESRIICQDCAKAVKPPKPAAPAKQSEQTSFMDTGTIRVE